VLGGCLVPTGVGGWGCGVFWGFFFLNPPPKKGVGGGGFFGFLGFVFCFGFFGVFWWCFNKVFCFFVFALSFG